MKTDDKEYDEHGNLTSRTSSGVEEWYEHDDAGNCTHCRNSNGHERWYDEHGNLSHSSNSNGVEE